MLSTYSLLLRSAGPRIPTPVGVSSLLCNKSRPQRHERLAPVSELTSRTDGLGAGGLYLCWNSQRCVRTAASASLQHQTSSSLSRRRPVWSSRPWQMQQHLSLQHQQEPTEFQQQNSFRRSATSSKIAQSLPTVLTISRVCTIPVLMALWFSPLQNVPALCTGIFAAAAFTDWLDGYLARRWKAHSAFGAFLDPVADKLMVAAVLILLSSQPLAAGPFAGNAWLLPLLTTAIIGREITMSALREWAASLGTEAYKSVAVSSWGKWKTATQMISLSLLLLSCRGGEADVVYYSAAAGPPLLCIAAFLTLWSLKQYIQALWKFLK